MWNCTSMHYTCAPSDSSVIAGIQVRHLVAVEAEVCCVFEIAPACNVYAKPHSATLYMRSGRERTAKPHVPGRTLPLLPPSSAWHYIDPEGKEQGPFDAKKLINWVDLGYFGQSDLQVSGYT